jgi:hypothetical protein
MLTFIVIAGAVAALLVAVWATRRISDGLIARLVAVGATALALVPVWLSVRAIVWICNLGDAATNGHQQECMNETHAAPVVATAYTIAMATVVAAGALCLAFHRERQAKAALRLTAVFGLLPTIPAAVLYGAFWL